MAANSAPHMNAHSVELLGAAAHSIMVKRFGRPEVHEYREGIEIFRLLKSTMNFILKMTASGALNSVSEDDVVMPIEGLLAHFSNVYVNYAVDEDLMTGVATAFRSDVRTYFGHHVMSRAHGVGGVIFLPDVSSDAGLRRYLDALTDELVLQSYWRVRLLPRPRLSTYIFTVMLDSLADVMHLDPATRQPIRDIITRNLEFEHNLPPDDIAFPAAMLADNFRTGF